MDVPDGPFCCRCGAKQEQQSRTSRRRGNGQGSVYKRGKHWEAQQTRYRNGERIVERKSGFNTKKEALAWLLVPRKPDSNITFKQLYNEWNPTHYPSITEKREQILKSAFESCKDLHNELWSDIGIKEMQAVVDAMPNKYYPRKNVKALFSALGEYAIINGWADKSFAEYVKLPPEPIPQKTPFSTKEVSLLWEHYNKTKNIYTGAILIMIYTGMRYGEISTVKPENIHVDEGYMTGGIKTAESKAGEIIIIDLIKPLIKDILLSGALPKVTNTAFRKHFDRALKDAGCSEHTPHECRHSTATLLAEAGIQPAIIQAIMRHTKYSQSAEYTHIGRKAKIDSLNSITHLLHT